METLVYDKGKIAFSSQKFYNKIYHFPIANEVILKIMEKKWSPTANFIGPTLA